MVTGRIYIASTEVEVVHIVIIVARRRPEVAVAALIVRRAIVEEAREGQTKSEAIIVIGIIVVIVIKCLVFAARASSRHAPTLRTDVFGGVIGGGTC